MQGHNMQLLPRVDNDTNRFIHLQDDSRDPEHSDESDLKDYDINEDGNNLADSNNLLLML